MRIAHVTACRAQHPAGQAEQGGVQHVAAVAPTDDLDDLNWLLESSQIDPKYAESALRPGMYLLSCSKYVFCFLSGSNVSRFRYEKAWCQRL